MTATPWWPAPAKLNLFLHITGRRADGFHDLQTVFQLLDWGDDIAIEVTRDGVISRPEGPVGVAPETDLTVRAARALQDACGVKLGARIRVRKRIPMGGGLGGGSSDAATVLTVLNQLWGTGLGLTALAALGLKLGADVPVFVHGASAWAEERGDKLTPLELAPAWYVVVHPGVAVPTASIFQAAELTRNSPVITIRALSLTQALRTGVSTGASASASVGASAGEDMRNDCEAVVRARYPAVAQALTWLEARSPARLSGTGSCVFARFESAAQAERIAARVPDEWTSFVARGVNRSPLMAAMAGGRAG